MDNNSTIQNLLNELLREQTNHLKEIFPSSYTTTFGIKTSI